MSRRRGERIAIVGAALVIGIVVAPFASGLPDGYERVALDAGFLGAARETATAGSPLADYGYGPVSGLVGVMLVVAVGSLIARLVRSVRVAMRRSGV